MKIDTIRLYDLWLSVGAEYMDYVAFRKDTGITGEMFFGFMAGKAEPSESQASLIERWFCSESGSLALDAPKSSSFITEVRYSRLRSFGSYENETIGAEAVVSEGEDPDAVLKNLTEWVENKIAERQASEDARFAMARTRQRTEAEIGDLMSKLEGLRLRWESAVKFLEKHGVNTESFDDIIPF